MRHTQVSPDSSHRLLTRGFRGRESATTVVEILGIATTLLLVYDDTARTSKLELKMMNFGHSFALPDGQTLKHNVPWDGSSESFDGHKRARCSHVVGNLKVKKRSQKVERGRAKTR